MKALIIRHKASVGVTPPGVIIVHETNEPVLMGTTPLSQPLLTYYCKGLRVPKYDRRLCKIKEQIVPPKNLDKFLEFGDDFFKCAAMTLEVHPYSGGGVFEGITLKEIGANQ